MKILASCAAGLMLAAALAAPAAAKPDGHVPGCADPGVLATISKRFAKAAPVHLGRALSIDGIERIHQHRVSAPGSASVITRRHCHATARISDGRSRAMWFLIEDGWGFAGHGDAVEFCLSGLDPLHVHGGHCRAIR